MADWAQIKFFWDTMLNNAGATLVATSTEDSGNFNVDYLANFLEINLWQAEEIGIVDPQYITLDLGASNDADADYLAILGHNLNTVGATITLQWSIDNFAGDINDAFVGFAPSANTVILKEFTVSGAKRYWRLKIEGHGSLVPFMAICVWGEKTVLDFGRVAYDPYAQDIKGNSNVSQGGFNSAFHEKYIERTMRIGFPRAPIALYDKIRTWIENHGMQNLFVAWETANNPNDVFLMRPSNVSDNPFNAEGTNTRRNVSIELRGRKE